MVAPSVTPLAPLPVTYVRARPHASVIQCYGTARPVTASSASRVASKETELLVGPRGIPNLFAAPPAKPDAEAPRPHSPSPILS
jgi:hypothetical protein